MKKQLLKPLIFLLLAVVLLVAGKLTGLTDWITDGRLLALGHQVTGTSPALAALLYILFTVAGCVLLVLPGVVFAVLAGALFGPWLGSALCLVGTTLGAVAAFLVGRYFLRDTIRPAVMRNAWLQRILFEESGKTDLWVLMITRLVPIFPFNLQNFAYGITDIRLSRYTLYTFLFMAPGVTAYTLVSAGIIDGERRAGYLIGSAALLLLLALLGRVLRSRHLEPSRKEHDG